MICFTLSNCFDQTRAVLGFRGVWASQFVEHVVFMTGGIRNGLAAVCKWIFYDWVGSVQNHEGRSGTTTYRPYSWKRNNFNPPLLQE